MLRLGILGSTRGTLLLDVIQAIQNKKLVAEIAIVISNKADALILEKARNYGLSHQFVEASDLTRASFDQKVGAVLQENAVDLVVLIGYMRILSKEFIDVWRNKIINVHPSLLPAYAGKMDHEVHQAVLDAHEKETGCTVHYVTETVDAGPILIQKKCPVLLTDDVPALKQRVQTLEGEILVEAIQLMCHSHEEAGLSR